MPLDTRHSRYADVASTFVRFTYSSPGCGKSVLAKKIAKTTESDIVLTHFFRDFVGRNSALAAPFVASVLAKLCCNPKVFGNPGFHHLIDTTAPLCSYFPSSNKCPLEKLLACLDIILDLLPTFTLVVDALDECTDQKDSAPLLDYLHQLGLRQNARVILLSRKHTYLEYCFAHTDQIAIDPSVVQSDISLFTRQQINKDSRLKPLEKEIMAKVAADCQGSFLWTNNILESLKRAHTQRAQLQRLETFPPGLFASYQKQLEENDLKLDDEERSLRNEIMLILIGAREVLTIDDVSTALALRSAEYLDERDRFIDPSSTVLKICWPLAMIVDRHVQLYHMSAKEFLLQRPLPFSTVMGEVQLSEEESHAYLALKTLRKLNQPEYREWKRPAALLRENLLEGSPVAKSEEPYLSEWSFYDYSCQNWFKHVTALSQPSGTVLEQLGLFLVGIQLVTWSEILFGLTQKTGLGPQVHVHAILRSWYKFLPDEVKDRIPIGKYFVASHESLNEIFFDQAEDKVLSYLPLVRLGEYFNLGAESQEGWQRAYEYKAAVVDGFLMVLGARSPMTLKAKTALLQEYFWQTRFDEAEQGLLDVSNTQREVFDEGNIDYYSTLQLLGLAQFYLNKFEKSCDTLKTSGNGLRAILGPSNAKSLMTELYHGYALEAQHRLDEALTFYQEILKNWVPIAGAKHPLSLMARCATGSIYRKRKQIGSAEKELFETWDERQRLFTIGLNVSVDSAIQLAVLYREAGRSDEAMELLVLISTSSVFSTDFERFCQVEHVQALIEFDAGEYKKPKMSLEALIDQATVENRDKNNRELLWIRITLADVLRQHGEFDEATMLFNDLVESSDVGEDGNVPGSPSSLDDEPQPPRELGIAEKALRLVKDAQQNEADSLLEENGLKWVRQRDFWIMQGGPITDTAWMDKPKRAEYWGI